LDLILGGRDNMAFEDDDDQIYVVLINQEDQYSLWPKRMPAPEGWSARGFEGSKGDCVDYVDEHWTDMRPLSLQRDMAAQS
jgi:MbtH protein